MMSYQFFRKFLGSAGAIARSAPAKLIASLIFLTPTAIAGLPPLSPNQREQFTNFRRNYGESPFLIQRYEPTENPNEGFKKPTQPLLQFSTIPLSERQIVEVSEQEFQDLCRSDPQAAHSESDRSC
jgi:hypothetical protein